jgi:hypothetical protein
VSPDTWQFILSGAERLLAPAYWLVAGLEWPAGTGPSEAAWAIAPDLIPRDTLSSNAYQVLGCAHLYAGKHSARVVFFSDLTRMFATAGTSWASLGVDWQAALTELQSGPYPAMFLTITERAHRLICDPTSWSTGCAQEPARPERELVRQAVADKLAADWSGYMGRIIESGRLDPCSGACFFERRGGRYRARPVGGSSRGEGRTETCRG